MARIALELTHPGNLPVPFFHASTALCTLLGLSETETQIVERAAQLCKADLVTQMVTEMTSLQGIIGREYAIRSQAREALNNPFAEEPANVWELRLMRVRDHLTDFYFAYNLPYDLFELIVRETLTDRGAQAQDILVSFNPELAPQDMLFDQAVAIEKMPAKERSKVEARLQEIKVVLIRTLISDQLAYVNIAKDWFTIYDLQEIQGRRIGEGKIGGKAAGMLLAARILNEVADDALRSCLHTPESHSGAYKFDSF